MIEYRVVVKTYNWSHVVDEQLNPLVSRRVIHGETMTVARFLLRKGAVVPSHHHPNEQISMIERGKLKFVIAGQERIVEAGEAITIPPHAPHSAEALEDSVAVDVFSPVRQDWIKGEDAYLRTQR